MSLLQGLGVLIAVAAVFALQYAGDDPARARALAFTTLVLANLGLIVANRSRSSLSVHTLKRFNLAFWSVAGGTLAGVALVLYEPHLRSLFRLAELSIGEILLCAGATGLSLAWFEIYKWARFHRDAGKGGG